MTIDLARDNRAMRRGALRSAAVPSDEPGGGRRPRVRHLGLIAGLLALFVGAALVLRSPFTPERFRDLEPGDPLPSVVESLGWPVDIRLPGYALDWLYVDGNTAYIVTFEKDPASGQAEVGPYGLTETACSVNCDEYFLSD